MKSVASYARSCVRPVHWRDHLDAQLRRLIEHAYRRVPYYRSRFDDCGLRPSDVQGIDDLQRVPLTDRQDIKAQEVSRLITRGLDPRTLVARETHGSTGEVLWVRRTWFEERLLQAHRRRVLRRLGVGPRDRLAVLIHPSTPQPNDRQYLHRMVQRLGLRREVKIDSTQNFETILDALRRFNPDVLGGYPNTLLEVGKRIDDGHGEGIRPRLLLSGGDASSIQLRHRLKHLYGAPVYDMYSCQEVNLIAAQCRAASGYHLSTETVVVEVLKDGRPARPGEPGEIVCTALFSFAMPFIRYRLNDLVVLGSGVCSCGRPGPIIDRVQGRVVDYFPLKDGRLVHPYQIVDVCLNLPWILRYQIEQHSEEDIRVTLASDAPPSGHEVESVRRKLVDYLGPGIRWDLRVQRRIPTSPGGKHRTYRSLIYKP